MKPHIKAYRERNREKVRVIQKRHLDKKRSTIEGFAGFFIQRAKSRGKFKDEVTIIVDDIVKLWVEQQGLCAVTKKPMILIGVKHHPHLITVDRIDCNRGYHRDNIRLVWHWVNVARGAWGDRVMKECCKAVI